MDLIKLPFGEEAPAEADCIAITERADGRYELNATALLSCGDTDQAESVAMIGSKPYDSYEEAEAAGVAWAADHCVGELYVTRLPAGVLPGV